ncbi:hypothetical protein [Pragia fontium]|uniref:Uncharacterized protein n=2 Tax=Pragia fontium TaxID=82985 RepID=A0AAJ4W8M6_9GAMM|nr:hypothetical protein [Pragia fontium]GKX63161.1 hypothetical protein SOASR032_17300 [Pragia fontium]SFC31488.1 hypothetical protein SAMN02745723_10244 [Pragia fontium DSM 5563 = ATCC 49100]VEJ54419.1 Uncharacterised protein [Pragia fontium]
MAKGNTVGKIVNKPAMSLVKASEANPAEVSLKSELEKINPLEIIGGILASFGDSPDIADIKANAVKLL